MTDPLICCIMPTCNRETMGLRATRCFRAQTYQNAYLVAFNSGGNYGAYANDRVVEVHMPYAKNYSIGHIRNMVIEESYGYQQIPDIIAHVDDDDISMPDRLQYQLDFMRSTGAPVVGFSDMGFYDAVRDRVLYYDSMLTGYALGTSLFYKREVWERVKFPDQTPEDTTWQHQVGHDNIRGCSSIVDGKPMMIQVLHGGNAAASASGAIFQPASAELDAEVRRILSVA